jgi:hypothetical protein
VGSSALDRLLGLSQPKKEGKMRFSDLFVPRWQNSNPQVRIKAIGHLRDIKLLGQIAEKDDDIEVREAASARLNSLQVQETV